MNDQDDALEMLQRLVDEIKDTVENAAKIKKVSDGFMDVLKSIDDEAALTIATVVAARVICETIEGQVPCQAVCATMSSRIYDFIETYHDALPDEDGDDEEHTVQ